MYINQLVESSLVPFQTFADFSATISSTSASLVVPKNSYRSYLLINTLTASDVWINFGITSIKALPSIRISGNSLFIMDKFVNCLDLYMIKDGTGTVGVVIKEG